VEADHRRGVGIKVLIDGRALTLYAWGGEGFTGATENYLKILAAGLADKGHTVHVVCPDLERDEERGDRLHYWPSSYFPHAADVAVSFHNLAHVRDLDARAYVLASNGIGADLGPENAYAEAVDRAACFSQNHVDLLTKSVPVLQDKCVVTGLGVDLREYCLNVSLDDARRYGHDADRIKNPGRIWVGNDPARGLWHVLDVFDLVKARVPHATLHVSYDFDRAFEARKWQQNALAELFWEMKRRLETTEGVVNLGALSPEQVVREQLEAQVHVWPSEPQNVGTQVHGISQLEAAAAGCALVLSDVEAFPEVFGEAATILPVPGTFVGDAERRIDAQDWADVVAELMTDPEKWAEESRKARALAEQHTWTACVDKWDEMIRGLVP
jgi:glycosyltransferase involved in cell wall biosynthesis